METVTLKDGTEANAGLVKAVMISVRHWTDSGSIAGLTTAYDAVMMARDTAYKPFPPNEKALRDVGFIDPASGKLHKSIAEILICVGNGDGLSMTFRDPCA